MQEDDISSARSHASFPVKLYAMLELADAGGLGCSGCSWLPHGRAFRIDDENEFMRACVPVFFRQTKIRSFYRQLYLWGFERLPRSVDSGVWHNEFFRRGSPEEMKNMARTKIKGKAKHGHLDNKEGVDFRRTLPSPHSSKSAETLPRSRIHRRKVSVDQESISAGLVSAREVQSNCSQATRPENLSLSPPEIDLFRCVSSRLMPFAIPSANEENQSGADHRTASAAIISGLDEAKLILTAGLEPLPFEAGTTFQIDDDAEKRRAARIEPLPFHEDPHFDEFASYIGDMIQML